jgi:hypothetical protein
MWTHSPPLLGRLSFSWIKKILTHVVVSPDLTLKLTSNQPLQHTHGQQWLTDYLHIGYQKTYILPENKEAA